MITTRRAHERFYDRRHKQKVWLTFYPHEHEQPFPDGFGALQTLDESWLPPGDDVRRRAGSDVEIVTYVREGALAYEDSLGASGIIQSGEFQRRTSGRGVRHKEMNASRTDWAHVFQLALLPWEAELAPNAEQKRFSTAERRGGLCVVGSFDARRGSLRIHQDVLLYAAMLDPGQHVIHELAEGRSAWLHLVEGAVTLGGLVLTAGDGAAITAERSVSLTAREEVEILLLDLGKPWKRSQPGGAP